MHREEMVAGNLRDGVIEVALEQRTEQQRIIWCLVDFDAFSRYRETVQAGPVLYECRISFLKLGGTTDILFALSVMAWGVFIL